jgi:hypothetical protein
MRTVSRLIVLTVAVAVWPGAAAAQSDVRVNEWSRGTTLSGFAGVATDTANTGPVIGGAVGWDLTPGLGLEGSGSWVEFGESRSAFAGAVKVRAKLAATNTRNAFAVAGAGLYRATFQRKDVKMPGFYGRRLSERDRMDMFGRTFTDPSLVLGGGATFALGRNVMLRPAVEAAIVLRGGRSNVMTSAGLQVAYQFESRPVTPARR